jgi:hypothetical protein
MLPQRRLPQPTRDLLWFVLIGAVVGAVCGHMIAISDGAPLLGCGGLLRGLLTGAAITGALFFLEQVWARPAMARLRRPAAPAASRHEDGLLSPYCLVGLAIGAGLFPAPAEVAVGSQFGARSARVCGNVTARHPRWHQSPQSGTPPRVPSDITP